MSVITKKQTVTDILVDQIQGGPMPTWMAANRVSALESFKKQGVPTRKSEAYKYARVDLELKEGFALGTADTITAEQLKAVTLFEDTIRVVLVNGVLDTELSELDGLPKGLAISSIVDASSSYYGTCADVDTDPFIALNTALTRGGVYIHVSAKAFIEKAIHIVHISSTQEKALINPRNLIVVDERAEVKIVESFEVLEGSAKVFNNALTEIVVKEEANVKHDKLQDESDAGVLVNATQVEQFGKSNFTTNNITLSGAFVRNNLKIIVSGEYVESNLNGLYITDDEQLVDNQTTVFHNEANCESNELYKGIINGSSTATFNGKIYVKKDAQKTNAFQSNKNILLSDNATINTKPQLEIYADDVKCSHGTTTGKIDDEHVFYLRSRGISEESAKTLLLFAFANEVIDGIAFAPLQQYVQNRIH